MCCNSNILVGYVKGKIVWNVCFRTESSISLYDSTDGTIGVIYGTILCFKLLFIGGTDLWNHSNVSKENNQRKTKYGKTCRSTVRNIAFFCSK